MKYSAPIIDDTGIEPADTSCTNGYSCATWTCSGRWKCDAPSWNGCSKAYSF